MSFKLAAIGPPLEVAVGQYEFLWSSLVGVLTAPPPPKRPDEAVATRAVLDSVLDKVGEPDASRNK